MAEITRGEKLSMAKNMKGEKKFFCYSERIF